MIPGAKTVPRNHANKNKTAKTKENMQILAIKSIENASGWQWSRGKINYV